MGGTDRERRGDAKRERERDAVGRHPRRLEAGAGSSAAVGIGGARTELVRRGPRRAELRADDARQLVRVRDRLARDDWIATHLYALALTVAALTARTPGRARGGVALLARIDDAVAAGRQRRGGRGRA